ncbi:YkgJ family cysteine cluster protein [Pseudodesulfovibrio mercurii]|uniref:YkgJ family cysteine cluster protein n=1 Tax=Pseudodesulfovibrio mercurii TaxID=641491 RepID=UPI00031DC390|nr:YkgJ family cysteine cluster protein [Pseudodesulfovibrio mercurii]
MVHGVPPLSAPPPAAQLDDLADTVARERMERFASALLPGLLLEGEGGPDEGSGPRIKDLCLAVRDAYDRLDALFAELTLDPPLACKAGCVHCCCNQVALTEPEALFLGQYLLETRDRGRLLDLETRTRALVEDLKGKSWQDIGMIRHRLPCLFLENGGCSVYPARPLACRGWNSVDVGRCVQSNLSENALTMIENHPIVRRLADAVQNGLLRGAAALNLEAGYLLMARAVLLLLEGGAERGVLDRTADWLRGAPFFGRKRTW